MKLSPEHRAALEEMRDRYLEGAALFREVAETLRAELKRRGWSDVEIDAATAKARKPRRRRARLC